MQPITNEDGEKVVFDRRVAREERERTRAERSRYRVEELRKGRWRRIGVHRSRIIAMAHAWLNDISDGSYNTRIIDTTGPKNARPGP